MSHPLDKWRGAFELDQSTDLNDALADAYGLPRWRECDLRWLAATLLPLTKALPNAASATNDPEGQRQSANDGETNDE